jgi:hypothetical protein
MTHFADPMTKKLQLTRISDAARIIELERELDGLYRQNTRRAELQRRAPDVLEYILRNAEEIRVECDRTPDGLELYSAPRWDPLDDLLREAKGTKAPCYASKRAASFILLFTSRGAVPYLDICPECGCREISSAIRARERFAGDICQAMETLCASHHDLNADCEDCEAEAAMDDADRQRDAGR